MNYKNLLFSVNNRIAQITINRPTKLNALNSDTLDELNDVIAYCKSDNNINVVIITGVGEKAFVAGADINELAECNRITGEEFAVKGQRIFDAIEQLGKPVIAAVNGFALGGGCELALACHIRIASPNAKFGQPELNLGIIPGYGGTQRLSRLINTGRSAHYILTGDLIDSKKALEIGLISEIYSQELLLSGAIDLAKKIVSKGRIVIQYALQAITSSNNLSINEGLKLEAELFGKCCETEDFKEGTSAFLEKRKPEFKNR